MSLRERPPRDAVFLLAGKGGQLTLLNYGRAWMILDSVPEAAIRTTDRKGYLRQVVMDPLETAAASEMYQIPHAWWNRELAFAPWSKR